MIKVGICDNSLQDRERLAEYIRKFFETKDREVKLSEYESGEKFLKERDVEILFLDIEMQGINGIELKEKLQAEKSKTRLIFTSSHYEMMEEAFGKQVFGFLHKPVAYEKFKIKLEMAVQDIEEERQVQITGAVEECCVDMEKILYIQADGKYSNVKLVNRKTLFSNKSVGAWAEELGGKGFFLCHRSYLANLYQVTKIDDEVLFRNGEKIPVSRRMKSNFKAAYREYIKRKAR